MSLGSGQGGPQSAAASLLANQQTNQACATVHWTGALLSVKYEIVKPQIQIKKSESESKTNIFPQV